MTAGKLAPWFGGLVLGALAGLAILRSGPTAGPPGPALPSPNEEALTSRIEDLERRLAQERPRESPGRPEAPATEERPPGPGEAAPGAGPAPRALPDSRPSPPSAEAGLDLDGNERRRIAGVIRQLRETLPPPVAIHGNPGPEDENDAPLLEARRRQAQWRAALEPHLEPWLLEAALEDIDAFERRLTPTRK